MIGDNICNYCGKEQYGPMVVVGVVMGRFNPMCQKCFKKWMDYKL